MIVSHQNTLTVTQLREVLQLMESEGNGDAVINAGKWVNDSLLKTLIGAHHTYKGQPAWGLSWSE
jgi:hypothetical protein